MKIKRLIRFYLFRESVKEMELNKILDKVSKRKKLSDREKKFLDLYQTTREEELKDFLYLSKNSTFIKVSELLESGRIVICNLHDRDGKFGSQIIEIENNFEDSTCTIKMKSGEFHSLQDKFLYNLIYNMKKNEYSLEEQDEYFEKLYKENED